MDAPLESEEVTSGIRRRDARMREAGSSTESLHVEFPVAKFVQCSQIKPNAGEVLACVYHASPVLGTDEGYIQVLIVVPWKVLIVRSGNHGPVSPP